MPKLAAMAERVMWLPMSTADVERSFNKFRKVLRDDRHALTDAHLRGYNLIRFNKFLF
jgi:hypothetical protein